jgi:hypothetical protein
MFSFDLWGIGFECWSWVMEVWWLCNGDVRTTYLLIFTSMFEIAVGINLEIRQRPVLVEHE